MSIFPTTPPGAKQTNCWNLILILGVIGHILTLLSVIGIYDLTIQYHNDFDDSPNQLIPQTKSNYKDSVLRPSKKPINSFTDADYAVRYAKREVYKAISNVLFEFINEHSIYYRIFEHIVLFVIFIIYMYHIHHMKLQVNDDSIEIVMGPWSWYRNIWCMPGWIASSQIKKSEIVSINRKQRDSCIDIVLRGYCLPVNWCCCHKSYNSYFWPCCCTPDHCGSMYCCDLCVGDSETSDMLQINLTSSPFEFHTMWFKRCAPCNSLAIYTCCVYNRIAFSIKDESWVEALRINGYPLTVGGLNDAPLNYLENKVVQQPMGATVNATAMV